MYDAGEIGAKLGVSRNMIGRLSEKHKLKVPENGKWFYTLAGNGTERETFKYYPHMFDVFADFLKGVRVNGHGK
jgi:hypothetical protein